MDVKTLEAAIVCINDTQGNIAGTGFLLDKIERLIVTCTHVLHEGVGVGDSVSIFFYATQEQVNVTVTQYVFSKNEEDIAILQIEEPLPNKVEAIRLGYSRYTTGHEFLTHGFPPGVPREVGLRGKGEIQLLLKDTKLKGNYDLQLKSSEITSGFSGAPIFDTTTSLVVGMIISIMPTDMYGRLSEVAYAISSETLLHYFPFLQQCRTECPYKGLRAFNEQDSNFFYGRQSAIENLIKKLENNPNFLAILGPSGSGKSSLVRAGLIPALRAGRLRGIKSWEIVIIRPEEDLVTANAEFLYGSNDLISAVQFWCQSVSSEKHLLIFIDQFEELFTTCPKSISEEFLLNFSHLFGLSNKITVVITLRDDFYSQFIQRIPDIGHWVEKGLTNILPLNSHELREIITKPADAVGISFEDGLIDLIIQDLEERGSQSSLIKNTVLPLLSFTLEKLWERYPDGFIPRDSFYENRIKNWLADEATKAYTVLSSEEQLVAQRVFTQLVYLGDEKKGIPDSRQRLPISRFEESLEKFELIRDVIKHFANQRLLVIGSLLEEVENSKYPEEYVEIIHDVLIQEWPLLQKWIHPYREFLSWHQGTIEHAEKWQALRNPDQELIVARKPTETPSSKNSKQLLLRGLDLKIAEYWQKKSFIELHPLVVRLIEFSRRAKQRRQFLGLGAFVGTFALAIITWNSQQQALQDQLMRDAILKVTSPTMIQSLARRLESFVREANQAASSGNVDKAFKLYQFLVALKGLEREIETSIDPTSFNSVLSEREYIQDTAIAVEASLAKLIRAERLPKLRKELVEGNIGQFQVFEPAFDDSEIEVSNYSALETQFTPGALRTTYTLLMHEEGANADLDKDGLLIEGEENLLPCELLEDIEKLWRETTGNRCGWFGKADYSQPSCIELDGQSLVFMLFSGMRSSIPLIEDRLSQQCQILNLAEQK